LRWGAAPTAAAWAGTVPPDGAPTTTEAGERARAIAKELKSERLTKTRRTELVEELNDLLPEDVPAREVVRALVEARVLRDIGVDALGVSPPWMVEAMVKTTVEQSLTKDAPGVWGRWCVDQARRPFVEEQLFACDDAVLTTLITRAVESFDAASLGAVAAVEALFVVVGDRLAREPRFALKRVPLLKRLAGLQVGLLAPHYPNGLPAPRTRSGPHEPMKGGAEFVAAAWAWSLRVEAPGELPPGAAWLFPGWLSPSLDHIPDALMFHDRERADGSVADAEVRGVEHMRAPRLIALTGFRGTSPRPRSRSRSVVSGRSRSSYSSSAHLHRRSRRALRDASKRSPTKSGRRRSTRCGESRSVMGRNFPRRCGTSSPTRISGEDSHAPRSRPSCTSGSPSRGSRPRSLR